MRPEEDTERRPEEATEMRPGVAMQWGPVTTVLLCNGGLL